MRNTTSQLNKVKALARGVQLHQVNLVSMAANTELAALSDGMRADDDSLELFLPPPQHRSEFADPSTLYCGLRFQAKIATASEDIPVVKLEAEFALLYEVAEECPRDDETRRQFTAHNAVYNAWPYWRELVQTTVCRMGLPPLVLPVFRIPPKPRVLE